MYLRTSCFVARFPFIVRFSTKIVNAAGVPLIARLSNHNEGDRHDFDFVGNTHRETLAGTAERNFNWRLRLKTCAGDASFSGRGGGVEGVVWGNPPQENFEI